jgi:triosephosphate isomerase
MKYFIANWKANKNFQEVNSWIDSFFQQLQHWNNDGNVTIILCPPYPFIPLVRERVKIYPFIKIGSQDISMFNIGAYTGEVNAAMIKNIVNYAVIGHSERRTWFHETDEIIAMKIKQAQTHGIEPILCVRNEQDNVPQRIRFVAYEPVEAIGTGKNEDVKKVIEMKKKMNLPAGGKFLYGGSVDDLNAKIYFESGEIDGFLVGSASLNPTSFYRIITNTI